MFNLNRSSEQQLVAGLGQLDHVAAMGIAACGTTGISAPERIHPLKA